MSLETIQEKSARMYDADKQLIKMFIKMDKFHRNEWTLPAELQDDETTYKAVDTSPHNALQTATKVLSSELPRLKMMPRGPLPDHKEEANKIERGLLWALKNCDKRSASRLVPDIVRSTLRYDKVCIQVSNIYHHYESLKAAAVEAGADEDRMSEIDRRQSHALRLGEFAVRVYNPANVHAYYDDLGLESVVLVQEMTGLEIYNTWGSRANFIKDDKDWEHSTYIYCDYMDHTWRAIWVCAGDSDEIMGGEKIIYEKHELPFLPWVVRVGGTSLDGPNEYKCKPFLESVYRSKSWELMNSLKTMIVSETIKYAQAPRIKTQTSTGDGVEIFYDGSQGELNLKPGEDAVPFDRGIVDPMLINVYDRVKSELDAQTQVQVLSNLNFPAGTAFATINAILQTAIASLNPYKKLAEMCIASVFELMLLWTSETGRPIKAYSTDTGDFKNDTILPTDYDPENIYLEVELNASAPTDRIERINAAIMLHNNLPVPAEEVLQDVGYADPQRLMRERAFEDFTNNEVSIAIRRRAMEAELELQQFQQQMQQPQQPQPGMGAPSGQAFDAVGGQGFDPVQGGIPPNMAAPQVTRENISGETTAGEPISDIVA